MDMLWIAINHYFLLYCRCQGSNRHAISCLPIKNVQYSNKRKPKFWVKSPSRRWLKVTRSTTVVCVNLTLLQIHLCIFQVLKHKIPQRHCCFFLNLISGCISSAVCVYCLSLLIKLKLLVSLKLCVINISQDRCKALQTCCTALKCKHNSFFSEAVRII